ncbi:FAD-binding and (Fe-S)-binding domain-containing protein [Flexivirga alba]|uniref:D-lactate dehydrogenase (cytochrome) n=1 Tax=Flexivirga alba TaxID=702742 RepID=A0ABW2AFX9_9MICO
MTDTSTRLRSALSGVEVLDRALDLRARAHDASHYLLIPSAVAVPRNTAQVAEVMRACTRLGIPMTFRSGGTSLSGQAVTDQILVDTRAGFTGVEVLDNGARVRVQPGVTVRAVNARLAHHGRRLGPDPASEVACTIGGVVADNSSGMQCGTEFNSYRTIESMVFVLPSGTVVDTARADADQLLREREPVIHQGLSTLRDRVRASPESVATIERLFAIKNTMGYAVNAFLDHDDPVEILSHLLIGSEGTLGFVASVVFRTLPVLPKAATGLLVFNDLVTASASVDEIVTAGVVTGELLDVQSLRVAQADPKCPPEIAGLELREQAAVLIELQAGDDDELAALRARSEPALDKLPLQTPLRMTTDSAARAALWTTRKGLFSAVAGARPSGTNALLEDVAVPVPRLGELCTQLTELFVKHSYDDSVVFGHARDGNLHFLLVEEFGNAAKLDRYDRFTTDLVDVVLGLGGTLKAEHGTGRIMAPFVERQYGTELYEVMREVKRLADPHMVLNPGALLTDDPQAHLKDLKTSPPVEEEVDRCVECGYCEPVCPSRSITLTPRQRIVLRRELEQARLAGDDELVQALSADYEYDGVQTCAADGMCGTVCPVHIDTGDLVRRLRAEDASRVEGRAWAAAAKHWSATTRAGSAALSTAHAIPARLPGTVTRWARAVAGDDRVPLYSGDLPAGGRSRPKVSADAPVAVLFPACIGAMFGAASGDGASAALVELCGAAGVSVRTPASIDGLCCGTPWSSEGYRSGHEEMRERVLIALADATDGGRLPVVVDASSCAEGLIKLLGVGRVGRAPKGQPVSRPLATEFTVLDALDFVASTVLPKLTVRTRVPRVVVHPTCATTVLGSTPALMRLAEAVADEVVVPTDWGCCAFAGDRGLLHPELTASATAPEAAQVADLPDVAGTEYVSANRTCELGMARATGQPYRHILEVLAEHI